MENSEVTHGEIFFISRHSFADVISVYKHARAIGFDYTIYQLFCTFFVNNYYCLMYYVEMTEDKDGKSTEQTFTATILI